MMPRHSSALSGHIRYLLHSLNSTNSLTLFQDLAFFAQWGTDESILILKSCLDHMNVIRKELMTVQLEPLYGLFFRYMLDRPNCDTVLFESFRSLEINVDFLVNISSDLHLTLRDKVGFGLALLNSEDRDITMCGKKYCRSQIEELNHSLMTVDSVEQIHSTLTFLCRFPGVAKHVDSFIQMLSLMDLKDDERLILAPFLSNETYSTYNLRDLSAVGDEYEFGPIIEEMKKEKSMANIIQELGYGCTTTVSQCKEVLCLFSPLTENVTSSPSTPLPGSVSKRNGTNPVRLYESPNLSVNSSTGFVRPSPSTTSAEFGSAIKIETLVAGAERRGSSLEVPSSEIQDKVFFIINNLSASNLEAKANDLAEILKEMYHPWFGQYMVMKRAIIEPIFHDLYVKFLDIVSSRSLNKEIMKVTYENCKVLLGSELTKSISEDRSLLKNLGSWLGKITIGKNQVLRKKEIDLISLILEAYEKGLMFAIIPFTSKILEQCQGSLAYRPPNPYTMSIIELLNEIYSMPNLKMNLKFEIEFLFKNIGVDTKDVMPTSLLKGLVRQVEGNSDFSNRDVSISQHPTGDVKTCTIPPINQVGIPLEVASLSHPGRNFNMPSQAIQAIDANIAQHLSLTQRSRVGSANFDSAVFHDLISGLFAEWYGICEPSGVNDGACSHYVLKLQQNGLLKGDDTSFRFFDGLTEIAVSHCLASEIVNSGPQQSSQQAKPLSFLGIDLYAKLVVAILKFFPMDQGSNKDSLLLMILGITVIYIQRDAEVKKSSFNPRPYVRLFINWLTDLVSMKPNYDAKFQVLSAFANAFHSLQPLKVPGFSFSWLQLVSHKSFMPKLLTGKSWKGWPCMQQLLVDLFQFLEPFLRNAELRGPVHFLYKGTLRVLLVLLHDFPTFLCNYHFNFCDVIPPSCIQMRHIILSAFPENIRLPDLCTLNLKIDSVAKITESPRILSEVDAALKTNQIKGDVDDYLKKRLHGSSFLTKLRQKLSLPPSDASRTRTSYNIPLINSLVLYVGMQDIQQLHANFSDIQSMASSVPSSGAGLELFQTLMTDLDTEGRYLFLNAIANQLRYPNNHTHYFFFVLLYLFAESTQEIIQEQITRVLLERLIVKVPYPWGLLVTFFELLKNPRYNFWSRSFTRCAPEIRRVLELASRSQRTYRS